MQAISFAAPQFDLNQDNPYFAEKKAGWQGMQQVAEHRMDIRKANQTDWQLRLAEQAEANNRWYRQQSLKQADKKMGLDVAIAEHDFAQKDLEHQTTMAQLPAIDAARYAEARLKTAQADQFVKSIETMDAEREELAPVIGASPMSYRGVRSLIKNPMGGTL